MKNFIFKESEVKIASFVNAKGKERITVEYKSKRVYSFYESDIENREEFINDVIFMLRDEANRYSDFNKKQDCIEFANLLIESFN